MNIEHAWAAGFWDGEGCVSVARRSNTNRPRIVAEVAQVHPEVLHRFKRAVGFGKVYGPYEQKNPNAQPFYVWRVESAQDVNNLRLILFQYLSSVKKAQLDKAVAARLLWENNPTCKSGHSLTKGKADKYYCRECVSANGRANALPERTEKKCGRCDTIKALEEFNKHSGRLDGRQTMCRACMVSYRNER